MSNITNYFKGKDFLENREDNLAQLVTDLTNQINLLFDEVISLSDESTYCFDFLTSTSKQFVDLLKEVVESMDYLANIEQDSTAFATKRFQLKRLMVAMVTVYAFATNALLGIVSFILLSSQANKDYVRELKAIEDEVDNLDAHQLVLLQNTVSNCTRLLVGKGEKIQRKLETASPEEKKEISLANVMVQDYIKGERSDEEMMSLTEPVKERITLMLRRDLNKQASFIELLHILKKRREDTNAFLQKMSHYHETKKPLEK